MGFSTVLKWKAPMLRTGKVKNVMHTGKLMTQLSVKHCRDVAGFGHLSPLEYYDVLRRIPYNRDPDQTEWLQRPYFTLRGDTPGGDCDDKAICGGAYAVLCGYPFRFVAMGRYADKPLHHVATDMLINGEWTHFDPTYTSQVFGKYLFRPARSMIIGAWHGNFGGA
jgi:hypothetical protein